MTDADEYTPTTEEIWSAVLYGAFALAEEENSGVDREKLRGMFDRWYGTVYLSGAFLGFEEGRKAVIEHSLQHVQNEPEYLAGYIDQHVIGIGGSKIQNPYEEHK